jgi:hypothetical protein
MHGPLGRWAKESDSVDLRDGVGTTSNGLLATLALPDTNSLALDGVLSAEGADVAGVLRHFHLLHLLTQGGTVSIGEPSVNKMSSRSFFRRLNPQISPCRERKIALEFNRTMGKDF